METQLRSSSADFLETSKEVKSVLRALVRLTYEKPQVRALYHYLLILQLAWYTHIWPAVGKITELARILVIELFHYAVDFGFGSQQTDTAARILLACTTVDIQGQIITRLREVLSYAD
jgi:hypothetical protein